MHDGPAPPRAGGDEAAGTDGDRPLLRMRDIFLSSFYQIVDLPNRIVHEVRGWSVTARVYLAMTMGLDVFTVLMTFLRDSPDANIFRPLAVVYMMFQFCTAFHAIYAQNEYTFVAGNVMLLLAGLMAITDYVDGLTGFDVRLWQVVVQCAWVVLVLLLAAQTYLSMEGFGWKSFHDVGARADSLDIHSAYRIFTATLSLDFLLSIMMGMLTVMLVSWPAWLNGLVIFFCIAVPIVCSIPLKKTVKAEMIVLLKGFCAIYLAGLGMALCVLALGVLEQMGHRWTSRIHTNNFPVAVVIIVAAALAIIVRVGLAYRTAVVVHMAFGTGLLGELAGRQMNRKRGALRGAGGGGDSPTYGGTGARGNAGVPFEDVAGGGGGGGGIQRRFTGNGAPTGAAPASSTDGSFKNEHPQGLPGSLTTPRDTRTARTSLPIIGGTPQANGQRDFQDPAFSSWTSGASKGPVPILAAKTVTLNDAENP